MKFVNIYIYIYIHHPRPEGFWNRFRALDNNLNEQFAHTGVLCKDTAAEGAGLLYTAARAMFSSPILSKAWGGSQNPPGAGGVYVPGPDYDRILYFSFGGGTENVQEMA